MINWLDIIEFQQPWFLLAALAAVPIFVLGQKHAGHVVFSSLRLLPTGIESLRTRLAWIPSLLFSLTTILLAVALAGPRTAQVNQRVKGDGIAIMMVVDVSGSMRALDLDPNNDKTRLDVVVDMFSDFVQGKGDLSGRNQDAIGLISFARFADARSPLTLDHNSLVDTARTLKIVPNRSKENATAIGEALGLAVERLRRSKAKSKIVILLTDGVNNVDGPDTETPLGAAGLAEAAGTKVYTIGAGTKDGLAPVRVVDERTNQTVLTSMRVEIDEETLQQIADKTGGRYFRATDKDSLHDIYQTIDQLERSKIRGHRTRYHYYYPWLVGFALIFATLGWILEGTFFRRLPC